MTWIINKKKEEKEEEKETDKLKRYKIEIESAEASL